MPHSPMQAKLIENNFDPDTSDEYLVVEVTKGSRNGYG